MAGKRTTKSALRNQLCLLCNVQKYYGYADYFNRVSLFSVLQISNSGAESVEDIDVTIDSKDGFLLPFSKHLDVIPFESNIDLSTENLVSPLFLTELSEIMVSSASVRVCRGKDLLAETQFEVTLLPFDYWSGRNGNAEYLSCFVRPKLPDCLRVLNDAQEPLKKWGLTSEWHGYQEGDKNKIRQLAAAIYAAIKKLAISRKEMPVDYSEPVALRGTGLLYKEKSASSFELALFIASCFECAGLHPILALGEHGVACGVWLYDNCFSDSVSDDVTLLQQYMSDGINNVSMLDTDDLFEDKNVNYAGAEKHFKQKAENAWFDTVIDIKRCRLARIRPLPLKVSGVRGYELLGEEDTDLSAAPAALATARKLNLDGKITKNKQWERRLLDLSLKNTLLNFRPEKNVLHIFSADINQMYETLCNGGEFAILEKTTDLRNLISQDSYFSGAASRSAVSELLSIELKNHRLRTYSEKDPLADTVHYLMKKEKTAQEEAGASVLFLAFGFLRWYESESSREPKYAPLVLCPVKLVRTKGGKGYSIALSSTELQFNNTLLEFLMREFKIDIRGLDSISSGIRISEILAMVRAEILSMKRWSVVEEVYLANFSFARYAMWNDIRKNIDRFRKNQMVKSLLDNRLEIANTVFENKTEDEYDPAEILCPLTADASQFDAISEATAGTSFVLHGPPGTGKSQTITNIIANCLCKGKRVLFVAEKQAALSVVKKRLDSIGIGDFCLELDSGKSDKAQLLKKMETTLALSADENGTDFVSKSNQLAEVRAALNEPIRALHKKRRLGVSVYEAILIYLKNKSAPDVLDIESTFYDRLTKEKLERYENMLAEASAAAKRCGGVRRSPFDNVNLREYNTNIRNRVYYASEAMIVEIKHFRSYLRLFLEFYRQKVSAFTQTKLNALLQMIALLQSGETDIFFKNDENSFYLFFNATRRLTRSIEKYFKVFKTLVDLDAEPSSVEQELDNWSENHRSSKLLNALARRLRRAAIERMAPDEEYRYMGTVVQIYEDLQLIQSNTALSNNFTDRGGKINFRHMEDFLAPLNRLHALAETVFMDYNADSFNSMCVQSVCGGYSVPVLAGMRQAIEGFEKGRKNFCDTIGAAEEKFSDEDILDYFQNKAAALIDNIDMLAAWCLFKDIAHRLDQEGLAFITAALEAGTVTADNLLESFRKNVFRNFIETNVASDPTLSKFSGTVLEEKIDLFRNLDEEYTRLSKEYIRKQLIAQLPNSSTEGSISLELLSFQRILKSNMRGMSIKEFLAEIPNLFACVAPCVLMSPITVAQYLQPETDLFDLVIFDEASQLPTSEAVGALARAKSAVVVGDPKQLPPTSFFSSGYVDEENLDTEDLESVLDDCLALSMPEKHLNWHYRSKHESLIAFSNVMYYGNRLCTFPSPDALESKVRLTLVPDGVYDRGLTKRNKAEAEALVAEVVRRLSDPRTARSSIGIVTFSTAQQDFIERRLSDALIKNRLEEAAYERDEPLFVKNLENVQGDERDVIFFSVCYGPDRDRRVSLNFGPLNQLGGWRRLNVAVSRAREEMVVFSSMTSAMINLAKTNSKGVAGLKAFLEFAEKGKTTLAIGAEEVYRGNGIGKYIAQELQNYGYECRSDVGASEFKIDCAVLDPRDKKKFILAILCDGVTANRCSAKDRNILQVQTLKMNNWNVLRLFTLNFMNNPKREIKRIKELLDRLTGAEKGGRDHLIALRRNYRFAKLEISPQPLTFITGGEHDAEIISRLKAIVTAEEPISMNFLIKRCMNVFGIEKANAKAEARMQELIEKCGFIRECLCDRIYLRKTDKGCNYDFFRTETTPTRRSEDEFTPYEVIALAKGLLGNKVSLYAEELIQLICREWQIQRPSDRLTKFFNDCLALGVARAVFVRSVSDRISLA